MANNRMYLVNEDTGVEVFVGKYYPGTGWYIHDEENFVERLNAAFNEVDFGKPWKDGMFSRCGLFGNCSWKIRYEDPESAKVKILEVLNEVKR